MEEMEEQGEAERRHSSGLVVGSIAAILVVAFAGFVAGRVTASDGIKADGCSAAKAALDRLLEEANGAPGDEQQTVKNTRLVTLSNVVLQNPKCFDVETRAQAQTAKDQVASNESSAAASDTADRITQCLSRIDVGFGC